MARAGYAIDRARPYQKKDLGIIPVLLLSQQPTWLRYRRVGVPLMWGATGNLSSEHQIQERVVQVQRT